MSKLYFFRHAQASFMSDNYDKLSEHGKKQSEELGKYLVQKEFHFDKIFVGPLQRQKKTFEIVADVFFKNKMTIPEPVFIEELREHSGPRAMRYVFPKLKEANPNIQKLLKIAEENPALKKRNHLLVFQHFMDEWAEGKIEVPEVDSWAKFRGKVKTGLGQILENTGKGETIGVFTSGGTISAITAEALKIKEERTVATMNFSVRNTSFTSFLFSQNKFNLLSFNELPHLEKEMITFV
ncbi:MAG: histidine phosphatase family protein [Saprospiraceae bacterium]